MKSLLIILLFAAAALSDVITLSGRQNGTLPKGEYIIKDTVIVESGETLQFEPGTVLKVEEFSGIAVRGNLILNGAEGAEISLTSQNPNEYLWNGVDVKVGGSCAVRFTHVSNAVVGITLADSSCYSEIQNVVFEENEKNFMIAGKVITAISGKEFSLKAKENPLPGITYVNINEKNVSNPAMIVTRIGFTALTIAGTGLWAHYAESANHLSTQYKYATGGDAANLRITAGDHKTISSIGKVTTLVSFPIAVFTFVIKDFKKGSKK